MKDKELTRIIHNLDGKLFFHYLGDVDILDFNKCEIKNLKKVMEETTKENPNNKKWEQDKNYLILKINEWCEIFRCYSLIIK